MFCCSPELCPVLFFFLSRYLRSLRTIKVSESLRVTKEQQLSDEFLEGTCTVGIPARRPRQRRAPRGPFLTQKACQSAVQRAPLHASPLPQPGQLPPARLHWRAPACALAPPCTRQSQNLIRLIFKFEFRFNCDSAHAPRNASAAPLSISIFSMAIGRLARHLHTTGAQFWGSGFWDLGSGFGVHTFRLVKTQLIPDIAIGKRYVPYLTHQTLR